MTEHDPALHPFDDYEWDRGQSDRRDSQKERAMTVCIAGCCQHQGENAIAMVCDWQGTYGTFIKASDTYKMRHIGRFTLMLSGDETEADRLIALITPHLRSYEAAAKPDEDLDIRVSQLIHDVKGPIRQRRAEITEHFVGMTLGVPFPDFRDRGFAWLGAKQHRKVWKEIKSLGLGCELIVAYADDTETLIFEIGAQGKVLWDSNFICIGSAWEIALASLCQQPYDSDEMELMECLGRIFLAKRMSEKSPFVGDDSAFDVLIKGSTARILTDEGWEYLRNQYSTGGFDPKKLIFKPEFLGETRHPGYPGP